jgi:hypothetical protein
LEGQGIAQIAKAGQQQWRVQLAVTGLPTRDKKRKPRLWLRALELKKVLLRIAAQATVAVLSQVFARGRMRLEAVSSIDGAFARCTASPSLGAYSQCYGVAKELQTISRLIRS